MKIAIVEPLGRGGMIHYTYQWCQSLAQHGLAVTLLSDRRYELDALPHDFEVCRLFDLWDPKPITSRQVPAPLSWLRRLRRGLRHYRGWFRLLRYVEQQRPDVVQFGDIRFVGDALFLAWLRRRGVTLVDVCHNIHPFTGKDFSLHPLRRRWGRFLYSRFSAVFVHYESNRKQFCRTYDVPPQRVTAIPHGNEKLFMRLRDPAVTAKVLRARHTLPHRAAVVLFFGSLSPYKGIDVLIEAFGILAAEHPNAHLVVAGMPLGGVDPRALRAQAAQSGFSDRFRLITQYIPSAHVAAWFELARLAVFPYRRISQSGALQIALSFGVASIVTRVGALPDMVRDGETALVVPADDAGALARSMDRVLADDALRRKLGEGARNDMEGPSSWHTVTTAALNVYQQLWSARHAPQHSSLASSH